MDKGHLNAWRLIVGKVLFSSALLFSQVERVNIHCTQPQKMLLYLEAFPIESYSLTKVKMQDRFGYFYVDGIDDFIKNSLRNHIPYEPELAFLIKKYARKGTKVLDIGAHIGTHVFTMANCVGEKGRVFAFEPQPKIFRELVLNMQLNQFRNIEFYWAAVSNQNGTLELPHLQPGNEGGTSLLSVEYLSQTRGYTAVNGGPGGIVDTIFIDSLQLDDVSLIKIDVEEMEDAVLDGARDTILRNRPVILIEIMGLWVCDTAPPEVVAKIEFTKSKLMDLGYTVTRLWRQDYLALPYETTLKLGAYAESK